MKLLEGLLLVALGFGAVGLFDHLVTMPREQLMTAATYIVAVAVGFGLAIGAVLVHDTWKRRERRQAVR